MSTLDTDTATLLIDFVEKIGLLRRDMQRKKDLEKYEPRFNRVQQKLDGLAERVSRTDPELAKALHMAWHYPARSLDYRNARHQKDSKSGESDAPAQPDPPSHSGTEEP